MEANAEVLGYTSLLAFHDEDANNQDHFISMVIGVLEKAKAAVVLAFLINREINKKGKAFTVLTDQRKR